MALTSYLGLDCEMVGTGPNGKYAALARASIVNEFDECVYDEYVRPNVKVTNYRTWVSGITREDLINGLAFGEVRKAVSSMLKGRVVVGHSLEHDFSALRLSHPEWNIRDTSEYPPFLEMNGNRTPSLRFLTQQILGVEIQDGSHCSIADAMAAMNVYQAHKEDWETWITQFRNSWRQPSHGKKKKRQQK